MYSLKKTGYLAFASVACLLVFVVFLGLRQYQLTEQYSKIITQSEESIFQFSTIREQITASLIEKDWEKVAAASRDLKDLNSALVRLQENDIIPAEYKLDMAKQVDLSGLAIAAKNSIAAEDKVAHSLNLQGQTRILADYLLKFDRIIVSQMRAKVVRFQTIMIGALGCIICIISFSLIFLYQKTILPLIQLSEQTKEEDILVNGLSYSPDTSLEISEFVEAINGLLRQGQPGNDDNQSSKKYDEQLAAIINEGTNLSNGIINYAQLLSDSFQEPMEIVGGNDILRKIISAAERIATILKKK
ncbi:MAG: hypothetical protein K0A99_11335 [Desulfoarculaceae bacterium]|nr:hypothetical protein [Desulfoarculaceae bacterium]